MGVSLDLLLNAIISGLLLGGFYAAVSIGVAIAFGLLDVVNIAHPAFILLGSYVAFTGNTVFGIDPILGRREREREFRSLSAGALFFPGFRQNPRDTSEIGTTAYS